jgi:steroid 5-alpha reductase family enzyme
VTAAPLVLGLAVMATVMGALWLLQRRTANAGIVDIGWSAGVGIVGVLAASLGTGWAPRRLLVAAMIAGWSTRLAIYIGRRVAARPEDGRYTRLREVWGEAFQVRAFVFFQAQAALAVLFALLAWGTAAAPVPSGCGATPATPTTSSSGCTGGPTSRWGSARRLAGSRSPALP